MVNDRYAHALKKWVGLFIGVSAIFMTNAAYALTPQNAQTGSYVYQVSRNGESIGQLHQDFAKKGNILSVVTKADIEVTLLGLTIYEADQIVEETWIDGKLQSLTSRANVGGDGRDVALQRKGNRLVGLYNGKARNLSANLIPSTMWNNAIVQSREVLDTSKAKVRKVTVTDHGMETITVQGRSLSARHYSFDGEFKRHVWYDDRGIMVAVEMSGKDGSSIRQELMQQP